MARPIKSTVDYFPHFTDHGKTLFVLQSKWRNDGYAVWFKLLERLGVAAGLHIDLRDDTSLIYLSAYCMVAEDTLLEIIDTLAHLNAIDPDLWQHKIVYCQHLVDNVADAYKRRKDALPTKEMVFACNNLVNANDNPEKPTESAQRKGKERERIGEDKKAEAADGQADDLPGEMSAVEKLIRQSITEKRDLIAKKFAGIDIEIEIHEMVSKCRGQPMGLGPDPWLFISRWLKNLQKPGLERGGNGGSFGGGTRPLGGKAQGVGHHPRASPAGGSYGAGFVEKPASGWERDTGREVPVASG